MTQYDADMPNVEVAFKPERIDMPLGEVFSKAGLRQLRIAEFTKYAHVTFFFNGGEETVYEGEDRILIDSPDVATYDLKPEMSAYEVTDTLVEKINEYREDEEAIQQALIVAQKESNKILTEAKAQAHDMIESAKTEQVRLAEQSASECERIVKEHKEKCAELIKTNTEITEKKINEVRAAYDEELSKFENLKAEVTQFKADLTQLYNKQIRLIMEIPAFEPAEDTAEEYEEEEAAEETQEATEEQAEETAQPEETVEAESAPVTDSEHVEKILNTGSFDPVIPKTAPAELKFGKNN